MHQRQPERTWCSLHKYGKKNQNPAFLKAGCEWGLPSGNFSTMLHLSLCVYVWGRYTCRENSSGMVPYLWLFLSKVKFTIQTPMPAFHHIEQTRVTRTERKEKNEVFKHEVKVGIVKHELYKHNNLQFRQFLKVNKGLECLWTKDYQRLFVERNQ